MKLLYVGDLWDVGTCRQRMEALSRLGFQVHPVDVGPFLKAGGGVFMRLRLRTGLGRAIARLNHTIVAAAREFKPDFAWFDGPLLIWPETVESLGRAGIVTINYTCDNPFSPMGADIWRHARANLRHFDLNLVPRPSSLDDYRKAGARLADILPFAFDPFHNYPAQANERDKTMPVAFIGSLHEDRPQFLTRLAQLGTPVVAVGGRWPWRYRAVPNLTVTGQGAWGKAYRRAILNARLCLSFITHTHHDESAHKSVEITACGSFLLAERSQRHGVLFTEGHEAEFFASAEEAADKARYYLENEEQRERLARQGCLRAWTSGYSNDERLAAAFSALDPALAVRLGETARLVLRHRRQAVGL